MKYYFYLADTEEGQPHTVEIEDLEEAIKRFRACVAGKESYGALEFMRETGEQA